MAIVWWAELYVGIPYVVCGRALDRDGGLDCFGLHRTVCREQLGYDLPAFEYISGATTPLEAARAFKDELALRWVPHRFDPEPGDAIQFWDLKPSDKYHIMTYVGDGRALQTSDRHPSCIFHYEEDPNWSKHIVNIWRYCG